MDAHLGQQGTHPPQHGESHHVCFNYMPFPDTEPSPIHKHCLGWLLLPGHADAQLFKAMVVLMSSSPQSRRCQDTCKLLGSDIHRTAETSRTAMEKFVVIINTNKNKGCK